MNKSTGSIAVALVIGAAIGFVGGRASKAGSPGARPAEVAAKKGDTAPSAKPTPPGAVAAAQYYNVPIDPMQPTKGPADARVTIVEVSEFQ